MDFAVDLHIHSALSPCADADMTPNNIVNMAIVKGLDIISVTDHNSASNLFSLSKVAVENGIFFLPGIEVQTREEIHVLCYFKTVQEALEVGAIVYDKLPNIKNDENLFGQQLILDHNDNIAGCLDKLLLSSSDLSLKQLMDITFSYNGVCIPAHIDRNSYSIISNLGFIPKDLNIKTVEVSGKMTASAALAKFQFLKNYRIIKSSDAHNLWDISERENFISIQDLTLTNILEFLQNNK